MRNRAGVSVAGIVRGQVTRVAGGALFVKINKYGKGERGPMPYARHRLTLPAWSTTSADGHTHTVPERTLWTDPPKVGDTVLVATMDGSLDSLIVIGVQS